MKIKNIFIITILMITTIFLHEIVFLKIDKRQVLLFKIQN